MDSSGARLVLTLCKSDARGSYHHAMIPLPKSYEAAVNEARVVFKPYIGWQFQASEIVLKYAIKRANGTGAWGILRPTDWRSVIRPDGDEVGVFISQDSLDLPYEPMESSEAGSQRSTVTAQQQYDNHPSHTPGIQMERKIMYLTLKTGDTIIGKEDSIMIKACQVAAYNAFKDKPNLSHAKHSTATLQSRRGTERYGASDSWILLLTSGDRIDLWVSWPPPPPPPPSYWRYRD
ncbi:hypothetical protein BYT27DRAFT_7245935 [Phlegmacium glaucopus]|nr:hypothetical protein BYT27DRAFT_7245935 [Phlegmacium glaucopus]